VTNIPEFFDSSAIIQFSNHVVFLSQFDPSVNLSSVFFILLNIQLYSTIKSFFLGKES